jgi:hypothetical protein
MSECLRTTRVYSTCAGGPGTAGVHSTGPEAHIQGNEFFCRNCCPACNHQWAEPMPEGVVTGEQGGLFE